MGKGDSPFFPFFIFDAVKVANKYPETKVNVTLTEDVELTGQNAALVMGSTDSSKVDVNLDLGGNTLTFASGATANKAIIGDNGCLIAVLFIYNRKAYEETKVVTLTAGHTVTYVYGKETTKANGQTTFTTNDNWKADTEGVTHHRAKCSVCGLYLDNDYVKHSYTEYVNVKDAKDDEYNRFAAVCECGHQVLATDQLAKNLRLALLNAAGLDLNEQEIKGVTKVSVVHIVKPYWIENNKNGIHVHLDTESDGQGNDAGNGAIKVQLI